MRCELADDDNDDARDSADLSTEEIRPLAAEQGVGIELELPRRPVRVGVDSELLAQIVRPLLENAVRYGHRKATVSLAVNTAVGVVEIVDDGPGVRHGEQDAIFEPAVRGSAAAGAEPGAGLGLSLARRLAQSAGGELEAEPSDAGGRFVLRLPLA